MPKEMLRKMSNKQRENCKEAEAAYAKETTEEKLECLVAAYLRLGAHYLFREKRLLALLAYRKILKLTKEKALPRNLQEALYRSLGDCYREICPKKARAYYEKALTEAGEDILSLRYRKEVCISMAVTYKKEKDQEKELYWHTQAQQLQEQITRRKEEVNDPYWLVLETNATIELYDKKGDWENAVLYSRKLLEYVATYFASTAVSAVWEQCAMAHYRIGVYAGERASLEKAKELYFLLCKRSPHKADADYKQRIAEIGKMLADEI